PRRAALMPLTPSSLGYRLPAEWEPHDSTWIAWPHQKDDWPGKFGPIPWVFAEVIRHLTRHEGVNLLVKGPKAQEKASDRLDRAGVPLDRVRFVTAKTDRAWTRDYVPSFVVRDEAGRRSVGAVEWEFNGWAKYDNHRRDARVAGLIAHDLDLPR